MDADDPSIIDRFWVSLILLLIVVVVVTVGCILYVDHRQANAVNIQSQVQADFKVIELALQMFQFDMGNWPSEAEGLDVLRQPIGGGPYIDHTFRDPWGRPYLYTLIEEFPHLQTFGNDGKPGGQYDNRDLSYRVRSAGTSE